LLDLTIRRAFGPVAVVVLASWLGGCSGTNLSDFAFGKPPPEPQVDPNLYPAEYKQEIAGFMRSYLANPSRVRDAYVGTPVLKPVAGKPQYVTCVRYNPRSNVDNKYEGNTQNVAIFLTGKVVQFLPDDPQLCAGLAYQRFPELEQLGP
jgi:hypothetical protein